MNDALRTLCDLALSPAMLALSGLSLVGIALILFNGRGPASRKRAPLTWKE